jgi:hypothetical protein
MPASSHRPALLSTLRWGPPHLLPAAFRMIAWWGPEGLWNAFHVPSLDVMRSRRGA